MTCPLPSRVRAVVRLGVGAVLGTAAVPLAAQNPPAAQVAIEDLELEQLGSIRITTASRRPETLAEATAAVFVVSREDIHRIGASSIPEALRLVPGLQVVRLGAQNWSVTSRGFGAAAPNKLLVLIDGRAVYSPLFSGMFWDVQLLPLDDVERIEVILGPGATLWGSNAVNGVINVVTRSARETTGGVAALRIGTEQHLNASARYGVRLPRGAVRVYGTFIDREPSELADGTDNEDAWQDGQAGARLDLDLTARDRLTVSGEVYAANSRQLSREALPDPPFSQSVLSDIDLGGGDMLARWTRRLGESSELQVQAYFDRSVRNTGPGVGRVFLNIADLELQHRFRLGRRHEVVWGGGYRLADGGLNGTFTTALDPSTRTLHLGTAYAQDDITLVPERWYLTLGAKLERNSFSGLEVQPNVRARWVPAPGHSVWSAVSRAVRIPSRVDAELRLITGTVPSDPPVFIRADGSEAFDSEELIAAELGYRGDLTPQLSLDLSLYYGWYDRLRSLTPQPPTVEDGRVIQSLLITNEGEGHTGGGTAALNWRPAPALHLRASYTGLHMDVSLADGAPAGSVVDPNPGFSPRHQALLTGFVALPYRLEAGAALRYTGELRNPHVADYVDADARLGWTAGHGLSLALVGQDLLHRRHREFGGVARIPRRAEFQLTWQF